MAETIDAERAHASNEVATADVRADGPAAVAGAPADLRAMRLAGVGAAAGSPPWLASDRGTVTSVLGTIQRTAGNRAACQLLERQGAGAAAVAQRSADGSDGGASAGRSPVLDVIGRGGGSGLDDATRVAMEHRFGGADFRDVRVHTGETASRSAGVVGANAYTVGNEIVVRDGQLSRAHARPRADPRPAAACGAGRRDRERATGSGSPRPRTASSRPRSRPRSVSWPAAPRPCRLQPGAEAAAGTEAGAPAIQRLVEATGETAIVPQSGRKPPGPGNDQVASFIRRWSATQGERMASASTSEGIDEVAADQGAAAGEESGDAARPGAPAAATGPAPARDAAAAEGGAGATGAPTGRRSGHRRRSRRGSLAGGHRDGAAGRHGAGPRRRSGVGGGHGADGRAGPDARAARRTHGYQRRDRDGAAGHHRHVARAGGRDRAGGRWSGPEGRHRSKRDHRDGTDGHHGHPTGADGRRLAERQPAGEPDEPERHHRDGAAGHHRQTPDGRRIAERPRTGAEPCDEPERHHRDGAAGHHRPTACTGGRSAARCHRAGADRHHGSPARPPQRQRRTA